MAAENKPKLRIIDDPQLAATYVDAFVMAAFDGSAMNITLGSVRLMPARIAEVPKSGEHPSVYVTARLALSPKAAIELVNNLSRLLDALGVKKEGADQAKQEPTAH